MRKSFEEDRAVLACTYTKHSRSLGGLVRLSVVLHPLHSLRPVISVCAAAVDHHISGSHIMAQDRSPGRDVFTFAQDGAGATTTATSSRRASISSAKSATSTSSESDTTSLTSSYTDVSIEQKFEHPLSPTLVQLQKIRCTGLDYISTLHQLAAKKVLSACSISVYSLDGGSQCCATICVHGSETGIVYNTAFGCQLKATKQKAAKGLVEKLEWFLGKTPC